MPLPPKRTKTWDDLTAAEKGAVVRAYGGPELESILAKGNGGRGFTDEELGNSPVLWPDVVDSYGDPINAPSDATQLKEFEDFGDFYMGELRVNDNPTMASIDAGTYEPGTTIAEYPYSDPDRPMPEKTGSNKQDLGFHTYDPNRGLTKHDQENFTGVAPGITLDLEQYGPDAEHAANQELLRDMADFYRSEDANRWAINPADIGAIDIFTYDPDTADIYTTDTSGVFDPTLGQLNYANRLNNYAATLDGSHLGSAADLQYAAASGKTPLVADLRLQRDQDALFAQQASLAARARGSAGAGLSVLNAQNNAQLGYLGLLNEANVSRAREMAQARDAYAQTGATIRQGDLAAAGQAAQIGQQIFGVNNTELQTAQQNSQMLNQGEQYNTNLSNAANQWNAQNSTDTAKYNADLIKDTLEKNRIAGMTSESGDRGMAQTYDQMSVNQDEANREARIRAEEDFQDSVNDTSAILANAYVGEASNRTQRSIAARQADAQQNSSILGAVGAGIGALATIAGPAAAVSDRRRKNIHGRAEPADFRDVQDYDWSYDSDVPDVDDWLHDGSTKGAMAQDLPRDLIFEDEGGNLRVHAMKALLRFPGSIGDLQRRVDKLEGRSK